MEIQTDDEKPTTQSKKFKRVACNTHSAFSHHFISTKLNLKLKKLLSMKGSQHSLTFKLKKKIKLKKSMSFTCSSGT